jgi:acetyl/propionyl-CoA carboxylase alpha subunit
MDIPIYYDPMIAKLVTFGKDRAEAIARMLRAIDEYQITGIQTTLPFGRYVLQHPAFVGGNFDTNFIRDHFTPADLAPSTDDEAEINKLAAVLAAKLLTEKKPKVATVTETASATGSAWKRNRLGTR